MSQTGVICTGCGFTIYGNVNVKQFSCPSCGRMLVLKEGSNEGKAKKTS